MWDLSSLPGIEPSPPAFAIVLAIEPPVSPEIAFNVKADKWAEERTCSKAK